MTRDEDIIRELRTKRVEAMRLARLAELFKWGFIIASALVLVVSQWVTLFDGGTRQSRDLVLVGIGFAFNSIAVSLAME